MNRVYLLLLLFYINSIISVTRKDRHISDFGECDLPKKSYDPDGGIASTLKLLRIKGKNVVVGVVSVKKVTAPTTYNLRSYRILDKGKTLLYDIKNLSCRAPPIEISLKLLKTKYDKRKCTLLPGNYTIKHEMNDLRKYPALDITGQNEFFEFEISTPRGVAICFNISLTV